jgi:hypothetical protein
MSQLEDTRIGPLLLSFHGAGLDHVARLSAMLSSSPILLAQIEAGLLDSISLWD